MAAKKFLRFIAGIATEIFGVQTSAGAGNAGDIPALDDTGRLDMTMMPVGISSEVTTAIASEALAAGDYVNLYNNAGVINVRKADASGGVAKRAHGYVLAAVLNGGTATIYYGNLNNQKTGMTIGSTYYLSGVTPGAVVTPAPSTAGHMYRN
jgi:hypothetical protein